MTPLDNKHLTKWLMRMNISAPRALLSLSGGNKP
jgi:hypothetical protein